MTDVVYVKEPTVAVTISEPLSVVTAAQPGLPGPPGGIRYVHTQSSEAATWVINHNLGTRPAAQVLTVGGVVMLAEVVHINDNQCRVELAAPAAGQAILH